MMCSDTHFGSDQKEPPLEVSLFFHLAVGEVFESAGLDDEALATYLV